MDVFVCEDLEYCVSLVTQLQAAKQRYDLWRHFFYSFDIGEVMCLDLIHWFYPKCKIGQ